MKALIVHDDPRQAGELAGALSLAGYRVDVVDSGLAAIRQIWEERYDRVLVDTGLRGMHARQLAGYVGEIAPETEITLVEREVRAA